MAKRRRGASDPSLGVDGLPANTFNWTQALGPAGYVDEVSGLFVETPRASGGGTGGGIVDGIVNMVASVPVVGPPVASVINAVAGAAEGAVATVTGAPSRGRRGRGRLKFDLIKGRKFGKRSKAKLMRLGAPNVSRGARGIIKINPVSGGGIAAIVTGALGAGAGYVVATKAVPNLVGKFMPAAAQGLLGAVVGAVGGVVAGRMVGKVNGKVGSMIATGSIVALGVALMSQIVRMLPSSVTSPIGLAGMRDYLQLSGPVPPQLFAGGLNDYVGFTSPAAGQVAEAASAAITEWTPTGTESF
jgi:hypothetical protein